jgi:hypothetical protein
VSDPDQLANWRRYTKLHTQLFPYLSATQHEYARTGIPVMRHLALVHPSGPSPDDEFLFGPDLLAAPVLDPGVTSRPVYLPDGQWVDLWRSVRYLATDGGLQLHRATPLAGRRAVTVPAPLAELPLLVRAGAVLALLPPDVDTLTGFPAARGTVRLADRQAELRLLAFPRGTSESSFYGSGRLVSTEGDGRWQLSVHDDRVRTFGLQASMSTLNKPFVPCRVSLDGSALSNWRYHATDRVLEVGFSTRSGTLTVSRCGAATGGGLPSTGLTGATAAALLVLTGVALARARREPLGS